MFMGAPPSVTHGNKGAAPVCSGFRHPGQMPEGAGTTL